MERRRLVIAYTVLGFLAGLFLFGVATAGPSSLIARSVIAQFSEIPYQNPVATTPLYCGVPVNKDTNVGTSATSTPATQLSQRRFVTLCNSSENSGSPTVKCRIDGTNPVTGVGNPGDVLSVGACVTYNISSGTVPSCIASASGTHVTSLECD